MMRVPSRVPECGEAEQATAKALVLDFETCKQKQKASPSRLMTWIGVSIETQPNT